MGRLLPVVLFFSNLLNYTDRQLFSALFPLLVTRFGLSDTQVGLLGSAFTFSYLLSAPLAGFLSGRIVPGTFLGGGILLFTLGTGLSAAASHVGSLFAGRMLTGIGEAVLLVVGPQMLAGGPRTGFRLAVFLSAMPVGSAAGFALASASGLLSASQILALPVLPGLLLGAFFLIKPGGVPRTMTRTGPVATRMGALFRNPALRAIVGTQVANSFVLGGMAVWVSLYLTREKHLAVSMASTLSGLALLSGGLSGMLLGGEVFDRIRNGSRSGVYALLQAGQWISLGGILLVLLSGSGAGLFLGLFLASVGLFGVNVPATAGMLRFTPPADWGIVLGSSLLLMHLLGDLPSPALIGILSGKIGLSRTLDLLLPAAELVGIGVVWRAGKRADRPGTLDFPPR